MSRTQTELETGIHLFQQLIQADPELASEYTSSLPQFFQAGLPSAEDPEEALVSSRRHLEWFVFERHSPSLMNRPAEALLPRWQSALTEMSPELETSLLESFSGLFEITAVEPGVGATAADLSGLQNYALLCAGDEFEVGDLLVGRLYPVGEQLFAPSSACAAFREAKLLAAVKRDVELIRETRDRAVFRIAQAELETMFFSTRQAEQAVELPDPGVAIASANEWLQQGGLEPDLIETILGDLREHPPEPENLHPGTGDVLGHWLDQLAFGSQLDLGETRTRLLAAWTAMHASAPEAPKQEQTPETSSDLASAMAEFERDCASGRGVSEALVDLEKRLALGDDDEDDVGQAPDFPGVVGAMVEEFLWEQESQFGTASVEGFAVLHAFSNYGRDIGVFEELNRRDIIDFVTRWIPENPRAVAADRIPTLLKALDAFCIWSHETHGALALVDTSNVLMELQSSLSRVMQQNAGLPADAEGRLYLVEVGADDAPQLAPVDDDKRAQTIPLSSDAGLRLGDYVRLLPGNPPSYRSYPPELSILLDELAGA